MLLWTQKMQFSPTCWKNFGENAEFFIQKPEKQWADNSFRKSINPHCSSGIEKSSFDNSAGKDSPGVWRLTIFCENSQKM